MIKIKRGLDLPLQNIPEQTLQHTTPQVRRVALLGPDYVGMRPTMLVKEGDKVKLGQPLFEDKKNPGVIYTSPGAGRVTAINRGAKRAFLSVEIELGAHAEETFPAFSGRDLLRLNRDEVQANLVKSGMWTAFRTRPFSHAPRLNTVPQAIFVPAMDTNPGAPDPALIIGRNSDAFEDGLKIISRLTDGKLYVCQKPNAKIFKSTPSYVTLEEFGGPHPAGLVGTHIHYLHPVDANRMVWHIGYQDVIAIGKLFATGKLHTERVISLAGPRIKNPGLVITRVGAYLPDLMARNLSEGTNRVISGSVLSGRKSEGALQYLGRFHNQVSAIEEVTTREFLGWQMPGFKKFSVKNVYASALLRRNAYPFTTSTHGSLRAMVPIGSYEKVMPLDIAPTFFLRSLLSADIEQAQALGALELDEEDLALCTFVCPGKMDYGPMLRSTLTTIEKEG